MSFPKAKLQHFYEIQSCAPPPGTYDPKIPITVKGAIIEKSERFNESIGTGCVESNHNKTLSVSRQNSRLKFSTPQTHRASFRHLLVKTNSSINALYSPDSTCSKELSHIDVCIEDDSKITLEEKLLKCENYIKEKDALEQELIKECENQRALVEKLTREHENSITALKESLSQQWQNHIKEKNEYEEKLAWEQENYMKDRAALEEKLIREYEDYKAISEEKLLLKCENHNKERNALEQELIKERENQSALVEKLTREHENSITALKESLSQQWQNHIKEKNEYEEKLAWERENYMRERVALEGKLIQELEDYKAISEEKLIQERKTHAKERLVLEEKLSKLSVSLATQETAVSCLHDHLKMTEMELKSSKEKHLQELASVLGDSELKINETRQQFVCKMKQHETETFDLVKGYFDKIQTVYEKLSHFKEYVGKILDLECKSTTLYKKQEQLLKSELFKLQNIIKEKEEQHKRALAEIKEGMDDNWKQRYLDLEALMSPFQEQLKAYELEKQGLESRNSATENSLRDLSAKYVDILGHQNHKQKIKHLVQLKEQIFEQKEKISALQSKIESQRKTIDKLKSELLVATKKKHVSGVTHPKGKENTAQDTAPNTLQPLGDSRDNTN